MIARRGLLRLIAGAPVAAAASSVPGASQLGETSVTSVIAGEDNETSKLDDAFFRAEGLKWEILNAKRRVSRDRLFDADIADKKSWSNAYKVMVQTGREVHRVHNEAKKNAEPTDHMKRALIEQVGLGWMIGSRS